MSTPPLSNSDTSAGGAETTRPDFESARAATDVSSDASTTAFPPTPAAMDPQVRTIQPGGGVVMSLELAWGRLRRGYLRRMRPGYVEKLRATRQTGRHELDFDPIDPRDVKYYRNQDTYWWAEADDPFAWRDGLPFVRVGLAELVLLSGACLMFAVLLGWIWWPLALPPLVVAGLIVWFFRDPARDVPQELGTIVAPADGKLVQIERIDDPELGRCVQFGIFLSIFNVHANRASLPGRVVSLRYRPGKFLNALRSESARENENLEIELENEEIAVLAEGAPMRLRIRQITGQFARRIVCWIRPGDVLARGEMYGMIKLGSRTELVIPDSPALEITAEIGDKLVAGNSVLGRYRPVIGELDRHPSRATVAPSSES